MKLGFHAPALAWLALLALPLIVAYFLKLRRANCAVSSLALWQRVLEDKRVNSPFQRFRRHLLLFIQLLVLALLVLAAMQPLWGGASGGGERVPIIVDCSASMAATTPEGGTQLEAAVKEARSLIDSLSKNQQAAVLAMADYPRKLVDFTTDRRLLHQALDSLETVDVPADISAALGLGQALSQSHPFEQMHLFTDGNIDAQAKLKLSFNVQFHRLSPAENNIGISGLNARRSPSGAWDLLVQVDGSGSGTGDVALKIGDEIIAQGRVAVIDGAGDPLLFSVSPEQHSVIEVQLKLSQPDSLAADNTAYISLGVPRDITVRVTDPSPFIEHALSVQDGLLVLGTESETKFVDVAIASTPEGQQKAAVVLVTAGTIPEDLQDLLTQQDKQTEIIDWLREDPLLCNVPLAEVGFAQRVAWKVVEGASQHQQRALLESRGYQIVASGETGPLILRWGSTSQPVYHLLFHLKDSELPMRIGFPVMLTNLTAIGRKLAGLSIVAATGTGVLAPIHTTGETTITVQTPSGLAQQLISDSEGRAAGVRATSVGLYPWMSDSDSGIATASLLSPTESQLLTIDEINFQEDLRVTTSKAGWEAQRPLWTWFAIIALLVLFWEWWYFQRGARGT